MLVRNLKKLAGPKPTWQFSLELNVGPTERITTHGWRYYEDTEAVVPPRRRDKDRWHDMASCAEGASKLVGAHVKQMLASGAGAELDLDAVGAALDSLESLSDEKAAETVDALEATGAELPRVIAYVWRRYKGWG